MFFRGCQVASARDRDVASARARPKTMLVANACAHSPKPTMVLKNRDTLKAQRKATKGLKAVAHPAIRCATSPPPPLSPHNLLLSLTADPLHSKLWDSKKSPSVNHNALGQHPFQHIVTSHKPRLTACSRSDVLRFEPHHTFWRQRPRLESRFTWNGCCLA